MRQARLSATGISIESNACISFLGLSDSFIKYSDIVHFEQRQSHHYLVKYLKHGRNEAHLKRELIYISPHKRDNRQVELDSEMSAAMDDDSLDSDSLNDDAAIESKVMKRSFVNCIDPRTRKPLLVILNPKSGAGNAVRQYEELAAPIFAAAGVRTTIILTTYSGQAVDIASRASMADHDCIVCVSGDGLPHEVLNGLAKRPDAQQAMRHFGIAQLPGGSGNAMSTSLNQGKCDWGNVALGIVKGVPEPHDIMMISQDSNVYYSFLSQSFGIIADCDLGTEDMRWMGGSRFTVGILMKCLAANKYPCKIAYHEISSEGRTNGFGGISNGVSGSSGARGTDGINNRANESDSGTSSGRSSGTESGTSSGTSSGFGSGTSSGTSSETKNGISSKTITSSGTIAAGTIAAPYGDSISGIAQPLLVSDDIPEDWKVESHPDLSMFYVGKMPWVSTDAHVFPYSEPLDGAMDMLVWDTSFGSLTALSVMMEFERGTHVNRVPFHKKVDAYRLIPTGTKNYLSVDGESYPCTPIQVSVVRGGASFIIPLV